MSETKQNSEKRPAIYFSKEPDGGDVQLIAGPSLDPYSKSTKYVPVIFVENESGRPDPVEMNGSSRLSMSQEVDGTGRGSWHMHLLERLLKNSSVDTQAPAIIKLEEKKKTRLLVKRGVANILLLLADVALIYTKDKLMYVVDRESKKYLIDKTLTELEQELDHAIFFRVNRQYIVNVNFIKGFKPYKKVKLLVDISLNQLEEPVIVSQQVAPFFKRWINNA